MNKKNNKYSSNLLKGGGAIQDTKTLLSYWSDDKTKEELIQNIVSENILGKKSRNRILDVLKSTFIPRYIEGYPEKHWIYLKKMVENEVQNNVFKSILYFYTAINEPLIKDFVSEVLLKNYRRGILEVNTSMIETFIKKGIRDKKIPVSWGYNVINRVASGVYAALAEFHILEGKVKRKISSSLISLQSFFYISFFIHKEGKSSKQILENEYWKLFLLNDVEIEHLLMEAHQEKYLIYEKLGDIKRINFFEKTFEEVIDVIIKRTS